LIANAEDSDGTIARVEFYLADRKLDQSVSPSNSYSLIWSNVAVGTYTLTAKAVDNEGAVATSEPVTILVIAPANQPPVISHIGLRQTDEAKLLTFPISAMDSDVPAQSLTYTLEPGAPLGASLDPTRLTNSPDPTRLWVTTN